MAFGGRLQALCDVLQAGPGGSVSGAADLCLRSWLVSSMRLRAADWTARAALGDGRCLSLYKRLLERRGLRSGPARALLPEDPGVLVEQAVARLRAHHLQLPRAQFPSALAARAAPARDPLLRGGDRRGP
ncbi:MAG: hypothetical protein KatS3mg058_0188 [Roseiflexus sp.]|nr:MAG: hypothetical protein KatS3mg058_0188 [Roseiflexus sp.]